VGVLAAASALGAAVALRQSSRTARRDAVPTPRSARDALVDAFLPPVSDLPGALESGVVRYLERALAEPRFAAVRALIEEGVQKLEAHAEARHGRAFADLDLDARTRLLESAAEARDGFAWPRFREALLDFMLEGYLGHPARGGNADARVWKKIALPLAGSLPPATSDVVEVDRARIDPKILAELSRQRWDAVIVGSGAGGGVVAHRLSSAGFRVLVLEKGPRLGPRALVPDEIGSCLRDTFVPHVADDPHILVEAGRARKSYQGWTSCCVGGGTVHMSAMLYRMHREDFESASRYGVPRGSTLVDWPIGYDDLRPFYDRIQDFLGLAGATGANPFDPPADPYPQSPLAVHPAADAVDRAALGLGLHPFPTPRGILTAPRDGRRACVACGYCGAYACPVGAKASTVDSFLAKAESSGRCRVVPGAMVVEIVANSAGQAKAVIAVDARGDRHEIEASWIVLAASAVESARLLLLSRSARSPSGLGHDAGQVGKNLVFMLEAAGRATFAYPSVLFPREHDARPFINRSLQDRYLDPGAPGAYPKIGTLVIERAHFNPIQRARRAAHDGGDAVGARLMSGLDRALCRQRDVAYESFVEMLPRAGTSVDLDEKIADAGRLPAARITLDEFPGEGERTARIASLARDVLERLKPEGIVEDTAHGRTYFLQAGTCRMGGDPASSVCDARGRVHGMQRLVVCDGSVLPTMGGVPPTFTIMANALRIGDLILAER
jgi:choline dehydrogenase-like flavoprotein